MTQVRRALGISFAGRYANVTLQLVNTMALARLLSPHEIGVYSVATVFMGLIQVFRDMGIGQYLIQERVLTADKLRSTLGAVLCTSWLLALVVYFTAAPVAAFYRESGLVEVLHVLALNLLLIPFGFLVQMHLRRQLAFGRLQIIRLGSTVGQIATGVLLAWLGYGFMSLAWASVVGVGITVLLANYFRPRELWLLPSFRRLGPVFRFGGKAVPMTLVSEFSAGLPEMILGRTLGMAHVAIYTRAGGQVRLFNRLFAETLADVGIPYFARLHRSDQHLQSSYRRAAECVQGIAWPLFAFLALFATPMVRLLYGAQWMESAALVPVMCISASIGMMLPLSYEVLMATGRINRALTQVVLQAVVSAGLLTLFSPYGLAVLVRAGAATTVIMLLVRYFILRGWALERGALRAMATRGSGLTAATAAGPLLVYLWLGPDPEQPLLALALASVLAVPGWLLGVALTGHPLAQEVARQAQRVAPRLPVGWMLRRVAADG